MIEMFDGVNESQFGSCMESKGKVVQDYKI